MTVIGRNPSTRYAVSQGTRFAADTTLIVVDCATCGVTYAIPESFDRSARKYHGDRPNGWSICCPFGHSWHYTGETEAERERRLREQAEQRARATRDLLYAEERSHNATKGHLTRQKKRVAAGVCPCCNRTFQQLARHMKSKHPGYVERPNGKLPEGQSAVRAMPLFVIGSTRLHRAAWSAKEGERARSRCGHAHGTAYLRDDVPAHSTDLPLCAKCELSA